MLKSFTGTAELWAAPTVGHGLVLYTNTKGHLVALAVPAYRSGTPDGGAPDAGSSDAGTVDQGGTLFSDDFQRTTGLGPSWRVISGAWKTSTRAESDLRGSDQAAVQGLSCMDCGVRAQVVNFAAGTAELDLRETTSGDRYDVALLSSGQLQIRRHVANAIVVLAQGPSGIADLSNWATISLSASGAGPVQLVASVNGVVKLTATDSSQVAITAPGTAGMWTELAGIWFGHFVVSGAATGGDGGIPDAGTADAGTPDAGIPDAGTPDAGTPDAGTPDAGTPDAGTPDAGTPDAGTPDAGPPAGGGILFSDNFNRTLAAGLGPAWHIDSGAWRDNDKANSDQRAPDQASVIGLSCADCKVEAKVVNFAATIAALDLRQTAAGDRYDVALLANGRLQIRRHNGGTVTVLADVLSGIADLGNWSTIALSATGAGPVALSAFVNGAARVSATDTSSAAITAPGTAGMWTDLSGVLFDDFIVTGVESAGGGADAGVDAGTPDAGISDAGAPDAGTSDAGASDAGTADAGSPGGILFTDDFNRTLCCDLGPRWNILSGGWRDNSKANSDRTALDRAAAAGVSCADCRIDASMVNFHGGEAMLELRVSNTDRYALALRADGVLEIRRYRAGIATVLASTLGGVPDLTNWASFTFTVQGTSPVTLTGSVNGTVKVRAQDSSVSALTGAGAAGIAATASGILFDNFTLTGL